MSTASNPPDGVRAVILVGYNGDALLDGNENLKSTLQTLLSGEDQTNNLLRVAPPTNQWQATSAPAAGTAASASQSAGAAGVKNVMTGFSVVMFSTNTAPTAGSVTLNLRDGATGAGTVKQSWTIYFGTATNTKLFQLERSGLWIPGSAATDMTLEFSAGVSNVAMSINTEGVTIQ